VALAEEMHMSRVIVQPQPGIASALGMLTSDLKHDFATTWIRSADEIDVEQLERIFATLEEQGRRALADDRVAMNGTEFHRSLDMRYEGQSYQLGVPVNGGVSRN